MDDGTPLRVTIEISGDRARIDFAGSGAGHPGNLNATPAIVRGAVIYVLRLLIAHPLPLNEGLMDAVELSIPPGLLAPPFAQDPCRAPAVVGGNVETSQRLVDILLQALGLAACSQGTMNNLLFGTSEFCYVEVLEHRYPVRVERFARRRGSGGAGRHPGGDGVVRELSFLQRMTLSLLSQRRRRGPSGLAGGHRGSPGVQHLVRDGAEIALAGVAGCEVGPGDRLRLETPGGGGYGDPSPG
jgi:5-oxoprolinase (ATP-hydrolysing)